MDVSIIIVSYNTKEYILNCLHSIYEKTNGLRYEVIIVDNASEDNSEHEITTIFQNAIWINNNSNRGFGYACNVGAKYAQGKNLFFLNPDTILVNNAVKILFDFIKNNKNRLGAVGGNLLYENLQPHISFGHFPSLKQIVFEQFLKYFFKNYYKNNIALTGTVINENTPFKVDYVSGADIMIKKDLFNEIGKFDTDFFMYYEETEMCFRLKKKGFSNMIVPNVHIIHLHKKTEKDIAFEKLKLFKTSEKLYFMKTQGRFRWKLAYMLYCLFYFFKYTFSKNQKFKDFLLALKNVGM